MTEIYSKIGYLIKKLKWLLRWLKVLTAFELGGEEKDHSKKVD